MNIIAFANQKGGVGKTMSVAATASILVEEGYKVLLIDLDAQRNLDMVAGEIGEPPLEIQRNDQSSLSILNVLKGECSLKEAIVPSMLGDLVRASNQLYGWVGNKCLMEKDLMSVIKRWTEMESLLLEGEKSADSLEFFKKNQKEIHELSKQIGLGLTKNGKINVSENLAENISDYRLLEESLKTVEGEYDYVLIDTNPTLTLLTLNALYAARYVVIPTFPESSAIEATLELYETVAAIKELNPYRKLEVLGVLRTKYSPHRVKSRRHDEILTGVMEHCMDNTFLFHTKIRDTERASEYVEARLDVVRHDPTGKTARDYREFVKEMKLQIASISQKE